MSESANETNTQSPPPAIFCIGMAGSGKTTFMQRLNSHLHSKKKRPYVINLDPAVLKVPFGTNIDIRDSVNYKKVMENYNLGPNGAIMTSLNLFATKIDQVLSIVEKRSIIKKSEDTKEKKEHEEKAATSTSSQKPVSHVIVDTPGQIECFIWSASGAIITDAFASSFPTIIAYIIDTPRSSSPTTFMSNMLYACSILYKTKLPMIVVFNKTDAKDAEFAKRWMTDFEEFQSAIRDDQYMNEESGSGDSGYMSSLMNSMSLVLEEFYNHLDVVGVSAYTGEGFDDFLDAIDNKVEEYNRDYKAEREEILKQREVELQEKKAKDLSRLLNDMGLGDDKKKGKGTAPIVADSISDVEEEEDEDDIDPDDYEDDLSSRFREGPKEIKSEFYGGRDSSLNDFVHDNNETSDAGLQSQFAAALKAVGKDKI